MVIDCKKTKQKNTERWFSNGTSKLSPFFFSNTTITRKYTFHVLKASLPQTSSLSPPHTVRKELSKMPREAVSSAVSSRVRRSFGEKFASRGREENI